MKMSHRPCGLDSTVWYVPAMASPLSVKSYAPPGTTQVKSAISAMMANSITYVFGILNFFFSFFFASTFSAMEAPFSHGPQSPPSCLAIDGQNGRTGLGGALSQAPRPKAPWAATRRKRTLPRKRARTGDRPRQGRDPAARLAGLGGIPASYTRGMYRLPSVAAMMALMVCMRFSACSNWRPRSQ